MKQIQTLTLIGLACLFVGCAAVQEGHDPVVVHAERTTALALEVFSTFDTWEFENRSVLAATPEIRKAADLIRSNAPNWLRTARAVTEAYKQNRTEEAKLNLDMALAVLRAGIVEAQRYLAPPLPE